MASTPDDHPIWTNFGNPGGWEPLRPFSSGVFSHSYHGGHPITVYVPTVSDDPNLEAIASRLSQCADCVLVRTSRIVEAWKQHNPETSAIFVASFPCSHLEDDVFVRSVRELPGGAYSIVLASLKDDRPSTLEKALQYPVDDVLVPPLSVSQLDARLLLALRRVLELEERKSRSRSVRTRAGFEKLLANISTEFISLSPSEVEKGIELALRLVGEFTLADRAYASFLDNEGNAVETPFEWCAEGIDSQRGVSLGHKRDDFKWFMGQYYQHRMINVSDIALIPEDAIPEREHLQKQGIQSVLTVPLMYEGRVIGYLGLDSVRHKRSWSDETITLLTITGQLLANSWERCQNERRQHQLEAQMQHAQKLESLGVLAGGIAHDFNNLLVAILANAGLAQQVLPRESEAYTRVAQIELAAQRAGELTNQMLAYAGKGQFVLTQVDLSAVVREMTHLLEASISKKATLRYNFGWQLPPVEVDVAQLRQIIMNLITNASDSMRGEDGIITISTGVVRADRGYLSTMYVDDQLSPDTYLYLEVSDTGCGMDAETRARIFDPFFTTKKTGHGLGLAATLGIVRAHGGGVKVTSEVGRGTAFRVLLPSCKAALGTTTAPAVISGRESELADMSATVLVVDDEEMVREVARMVLERAGCRVIEAKDANEALAVYRVEFENIDLVLLDLMMPGMSGDEAFEALKAVNPAVRVLLSSGYTEQEATGCFAGRGLAGFIHKPYRAAELTSKIEQMIGAQFDTPVSL